MPSKARPYLLSPLAEADLEDIWLYSVKTWSREQAETYHAGIVAAFEGLASGAKIGRRTEFREGYFQYAVGSHLVFYRETESRLVVIRILHNRMDPAANL